MTDRSARNFMRVAERFEDKSEIISDFEPTVLYALAAPSTPDEVVEKALQQAQIGETISRKSVAELKRDLADPERNRQTSRHSPVEIAADPKPVNLAKITTAELVAELERRAAGEGRDEVRHLAEAIRG